MHYCNVSNQELVQEQILIVDVHTARVGYVAAANAVLVMDFTNATITAREMAVVMRTAQRYRKEFLTWQKFRLERQGKRKQKNKKASAASFRERAIKSNVTFGLL